MNRPGSGLSLILLVVVLLALVCVGCSIPEVAATPRVAWLDIDGDVGASNTSGSLSATSDTDDLGLDAGAVFVPTVAFDWDPVHVNVNAVMAGYSGNGKATGKLTLGDFEIEQGTRVRTDVGLDMVTGTIVYDILPAPTVDLGIGIGVGSLWYDIMIESKTTNAEIGRDGNLPMGFIAVRGAAEIGPVTVIGTLGGMALEYDDDEVSYIDLDLCAGYRLFGEESVFEGRVVVGYRYMDVDCEWEETGGRIEANLKFHGPYVGFALSF